MCEEFNLATIANLRERERSAIAVELRHASRSRRSLVLVGRSGFTASTAAARTTAAATSTAAAVTAAAAATVMVVVVMTTTAAASTTTAAAMTAVTGDGYLFTAHKGDADDREKHRDAQD
jgi:hypothetical protein